MYHPLQLSPALGPKLFQRKKYGMSGFFDDVFDDVWSGITGLNDAVGDAITSVTDIVKNLGETIALVVRAAIGDVKWSEVFDSLGEVFQDVGNVIVVLNPDKLRTEFLTQSKLFSHAFSELDKFTGGMLTSQVNVSTLVYRAMRGDPISKRELLMDALFAIQVAGIIFAGPIGLGVAVGSMVGREVCKNQTQARDACLAAFMVLGAALGSYGSSATGLNWGSSYWNAGELSDAEAQAWLNGDEAYAKFLENQAKEAAVASSKDFFVHLTAAGQKYLEQQGIDQLTVQAVQLCQTNDVIGDRECEILGQVARDYVLSDEDTPWEEFLATEIAQIGAEELMLQWFPENSKEHQAIKRRWEIKYVDVPVDQTVVQRKIDPKTFLLIAGAAAFVIANAGS